MNIKHIKKILLPALLLLALGLGGCGETAPLPEANGTVDAVSLAERSAVRIDEISEEYRDHYAVYYTAEEFTALMDNITGSYIGIGVYIYENQENGRVTILSAIKDSSAYEAGLRPGDQILRVNGEDVTQETSESLSSMFKTAEVGTSFELTVFRPDEGELDFTVVVSDVEYPTVDYKMLSAESGVGLIKISSFNMLTDEQFSDAYEALLEEGMKGLILDLRDNGGGEVTSALSIADYLTDEDANLMYMVKTDGVYSYYGEKERYDIPLVTLQNGNSASASELLLGAIQDNEAGTLMGTLSFGKGIVQSIVSLDSGAGLRYTFARYLTADGHEVQDVGITPDIVCEQPEGTAVFASYLMDPEEDPQLTAAMEEMERQLAAS